MSEIIINESFDDDDDVDMLFNKVEERDFGSSELLKLKVDAEEIQNEGGGSGNIDKLISWDVVKKNLEYHLAYQTEGALKILRDFNGTALLADEVGLGKTITTGIVLKECIMRGFTKKILILTPPSLVDQWVAELREKFEIDFKIIESDADWEDANFAIASIDRVKNYNREEGRFRHEKAHEVHWDLLIVDEAHKLKSRTTTRWKFVDKIKKKRFLILTATPFQNDLLELYNLLHILKRGHLGTVQEFRRNFLNRGNKRYPLNPYELKRKLNELMVRRKRSETKINYTKRIPKIVAVDLTKEEMEVYEAMCDLIKKQYFSASGSEINGKLAVYAILPKVTSSIPSAMESLTNMINNEKYHEKTKDSAKMILHAYQNLKVDSKINKLIEIVKKTMKDDKDTKMLIYTKHPTTLRYIAEQLRPLGLKVIEFVGGLDREEKTRRIMDFKSSADIMISTETGCEGLNFQFCNALINYDLPWNPMSVEQRIGRLDRIGQKKDMYIYSLATKGTMEEHVVDLIINKMCCVGLVIGELPIILFNLGLDGYSEKGVNKIEERLMNSFIDSKNNLEVFSSEVNKIADLIDEGIEAYKKDNDYNEEMLDKI
jgi:SNF2 family DNA or RNA helicase